MGVLEEVPVSVCSGHVERGRAFARRTGSQCDPIRHGSRGAGSGHLAYNLVNATEELFQLSLPSHHLFLFTASHTAQGWRQRSQQTLPAPGLMGKRRQVCRARRQQTRPPAGQRWLCSMRFLSAVHVSVPFALKTALEESDNSPFHR